jgi:hypothetical protein
VIYTQSMPPSHRPSASILAAGIAAIVGGIVVAGYSVFMLIVTSRINFANLEPGFPTYGRLLSNAIWTFLLLAAVFVFSCGVAVMQLRNWARISLMVVGGCMLFFGLVGVAATFFTVMVMDVPGPPGTKAILVAVLAVVYGLPTAVALWWLILFTRRSVVAQFEARRAAFPPARTIRFSKPGCPLPVSIVAWFLLSSILSLVIIPFLPFPIPVVLFGHIYHGAAAWVMLTVQFGLIAISSIGLLRLQRWSFPLSVALQLLYIANGLITFVDPSYVDKLKAVMAGMHLPAMPLGMPDFLRYARYFGIFGLLIPAACVVCLLYSRDAFIRAAQSSAAPGSQMQGT